MISQTMTFRFPNACQLVETFKKLATELLLSFFQPPCLQIKRSDHPFVFAENL